MSVKVKRTYAIPENVIKDFEDSIPVGKRSAVIVEIMSEWIENRKRNALRVNIITGCREMADVQLELEHECHSLEEELANG